MNARLTPLRQMRVEPDGVMTDDQFRRFAKGISSIVWRMSLDGSRLVAPRWAEITGQPEGSLQKGGWLATVQGDDQTAVSEALRSSRAHGSHFEVDFRIRMRNGDHHWFRSRGEPVRDDRGHPVGLIGIASNIDGQKRAEAALVENEARLRCIIDAARVGTIDHDLITGRMRCSESALRLLDLRTDVGLTFETVVSRVHRRIGPLSVAQSIWRPARMLTAASTACSARCTPMAASSGPRRAARINSTGKRAERRPVRFFGVASDLSGQMRELEERARLSAIVRSSNDAIIATTSAGLVTHWNDAAERIYGFSAAEMVTAILVGIELAVNPTPSIRSRAHTSTKFARRV